MAWQVELSTECLIALRIRASKSRPGFFPQVLGRTKHHVSFLRAAFGLAFEIFRTQDGSLVSSKRTELLISHSGESGTQLFSILQKAPGIQINAPLSRWFSRVDLEGTDGSNGTRLDEATS